MLKKFFLGTGWLLSMVCVGLIVFWFCPKLLPWSEKAREWVWVDVLGRTLEGKLPPLPDRFVGYERLEMVPLYNGARMRSDFKTTEGDIASRERLKDESYLLDVVFRVQVPSASRTMENLSSVNEKLGEVFPWLGSALGGAKVSSFYHSLYERKVRVNAQNLKYFERVLSRHNFFDCETILEMKCGPKKKKVLLIQSEMDVVTDGTDPDRTLVYDASSRWFQPFTSYSWAKKGNVENPFIAPKSKELAELGGKLEKGEGNEGEIRRRMRVLKQEVEALKYRSSLVATLDPFIVIPGFMLGRKGYEFALQIGDYAVVVYEDQVYPAVVGDAGPSAKIGEASLLICKEINEKSSGISRPVSDLKVTYLVFPGSRDEKFGAPDLKKWKEKCESLLGEVGGVGVKLADWEEILKRKNESALNEVSATQ